MILIASLVGGAVIGYRIGADRRGTRRFLTLWISVFAAQTVFLVATADNPRDRDTGGWDVGYVPFSIIVLLLGLIVLHTAAAIRRRGRSGRPAGQPLRAASGRSTGDLSDDVGIDPGVA